MSTHSRILPLSVLGCNPCGTRWAQPNPYCWSCGREGVEAQPPYIPTGGAVPFGMHEELMAARRNGPVLSDDPSGGGPCCPKGENR